MKPQPAIRCVLGAIVLGAVLLPTGPASAQLYLSATVAGEDVLLELDDSGASTDVSVASRRAYDLDTDLQGRVIAVCQDDASFAVFRWDLDTHGEDRLAEVSYLYSSVATSIDGSIVIGDGALGIKRWSATGDVEWLLENPRSDGALRYQGIQLAPFEGSGDVIYALRRPLAFASEPTDVLRLLAESREVAEIARLPVEAHHQSLVHATLVIPEYGGPEGDETILLDTGSGEIERAPAIESVTTWDTTVAQDGRGYRLVNRAHIEVWEPTSRSWSRWLSPEADSIWAIGPTGGLLPRALGCPTDNHGAYVSCVAIRTQQLVKSGVLTKTDRQVLLETAARSSIGKRAGDG